MQVIPTPPVPVVPGAVPQETLNKSLPQLQAQSAAPIIQRAVDPSNKADRDHKSRSNGDRAKGGASSPSGRGGAVKVVFEMPERGRKGPAT